MFSVSPVLAPDGSSKSPKPFPFQVRLTQPLLHAPVLTTLEASGELAQADQHLSDI